VRSLKSSSSRRSWARLSGTWSPGTSASHLRRPTPWSAALVGSALAHAGGRSIRAEGLIKVIESLVVSPLVGSPSGSRSWSPSCGSAAGGARRCLSSTFRRLQVVSAGFMALSHGSNDAQKTMGIITMSLTLYSGVSQTGAQFHVPLWVMVACAVAMGAGTMAGGVRIIKTMGTKIIELRPIDGFAAETSAALTIVVCLAPGHARLDDATCSAGRSWESARAGESQQCGGG